VRSDRAAATNMTATTPQPWSTKKKTFAVTYTEGEETGTSVGTSNRKFGYKATRYTALCKFKTRKVENQQRV